MTTAEAAALEKDTRLAARRFLRKLFPPEGLIEIVHQFCPGGQSRP